MREQKFPKGQALGFALNRSSSIFASLLIAETTYFATNSLAIAAVAISSGLAVKTALDAVTDLLMGAIIDSTHSKWGKARPYALAGVLAWLSLFAIFFIPTGMFDVFGEAKQTAMVIYIVIFATLESAVFETMRGIAFDTHMKRSVINTDYRIKIMTICGIIFSVGAMAMQALLPMLIDIFNGSQVGFEILTTAFGIFGIVGSILCFVLCKEYSQEELDTMAGIDTVENNIQEKVSILEFLKSVVKNKYIFMWMIIYFMFAFYYTSAFSAGQYYFQYVYGDLSSFTWVMVSSAFAFPIMAFIPALTRKMGIVNMIRASMVIAFVGVVLRMLFPTSLVMHCIGYLCMSLPNLPICFVGSQLNIEIMEYGRYTSGSTAEAMYSSFSNFAYKIAGSVCGLVLGLVLTKTGFDALTQAVAEGGFASWDELAVLGEAGFNSYVKGGADTVNAAMNGIDFMFNMLPLIVIGIDIVILIFFNLEKDLKKLRLEHGLNEDGTVRGQQ